MALIQPTCTFLPLKNSSISAAVGLFPAVDGLRQEVAAGDSGFDFNFDEDSISSELRQISLEDDVSLL
ncbi:hypothetical protein Hanom_Chr10g00930581 [Helianthus anomalus]